MSKVADAKKRLEGSRLWQELSDKAKESIFEMLNELNPSSPEELNRMVLVGDCPRCGCKNTKDCETVVDIEDTTIGICLDCGYLWCLECGYELTEKNCPHWIACSDCDQTGVEGSCANTLEISECPIIQDFMKNKHEMVDDLLRDPKTMTTEELIDFAQNHCTVCGKNFIADNPVFGVATGMVMDKTEMKRLAGKMVLINMSGHRFVGVVPTPDSDAAKEGANLLFALCSEKCQEFLKSIVRENIQDFKNVVIQELGNPEIM